MSIQYLLDEDRQCIIDMINIAEIVYFDDIEMSKTEAIKLVKSIANHDL